MFLSVVIPVHNECPGLSAAVLQITAAVSALCNEYEVLLVDDGSADDSWSLVQTMTSTRPTIRGIRLSRNYGKEAAIFAGLSRSRGDHVLIMDSDLQHPPEAIAPMFTAYLEQGVDVMNGIKVRRARESTAYRVLALAFNKVFSRLSGMDLENASDFKIMSRQVVDSLLELHERGIFFRGLTHWVGFSHATHEFEVAEREHGTSSWSVPRLFRFAFNALTSYTSSLLHVVSIMGLFFAGFALILGLQTLVNKFAGHAVDGFTTVILLLLIIGAVIMLSLGIIGQYIARIYEEVKGRPRYIIRDET